MFTHAMWSCETAPLWFLLGVALGIGGAPVGVFVTLGVFRALRFAVRRRKPVPIRVPEPAAVGLIKLGELCNKYGNREVSEAN